MILCTTMIPSYKRPALLMLAIESFRKTAVHPEEHEVIVRLSDKDPHSERQKAALLAMFDNCQVIIGEHMNGYQGLGAFYTEMIGKASGQWINIWDDDMTIEGEGWDEKLKIAPERSMVVCDRYKLGPNLYDSGSCDGSGTGWFVHLKTWRAIGETEVGNPPDTYMVKVCQKWNWNAHRLPGIVLNHQWQRPTDGNR